MDVVRKILILLPIRAEILQGPIGNDSRIQSVMDFDRYLLIYLSTAVGLTPGGSGTVHIYTQTIHRTTRITTEQHK